MAKRKLQNKLVYISDIKEELRPISISNVDYITPSGQIYTDYGNGYWYHKTGYKNNHNGYWYVSIKRKDGVQVNRRIHRLLAQAYIPNPENHPVVMHIDNNKDNFSLSNLKWGTVQENTQQAFDDGLEVNAQGFEDSQSFPVCIFDINHNLLNIFGSICIASKTVGVSKSTISRHCKHEINTHPRQKFYFRYLDEYEKSGFVL